MAARSRPLTVSRHRHKRLLGACFVRRQLRHSALRILCRFRYEDGSERAVANPLAVDDLGEDPDRWLVIGPDSAGNLLEIVVLIASTADEIIIHAMPMRPKYRKLLEP